MSIATRTGDNGTTGLMFNRRVPKTHVRIEACGAIDELTAALGLARASNRSPFLQSVLLAIQKDLILLMGEIATETSDRERYLKAGFEPLGSSQLARVDQCLAELEAQQGRFSDWVLPGATMTSAFLDLARATCRRAERRVCALRSETSDDPSVALQYLNRLADLLWLLARRMEQETAPEPTSR